MKNYQKRFLCPSVFLITCDELSIRCFILFSIFVRTMQKRIVLIISSMFCAHSVSWSTLIVSQTAFIRIANSSLYTQPYAIMVLIMCILCLTTFSVLLEASVHDNRNDEWFGGAENIKKDVVWRYDKTMSFVWYYYNIDSLFWLVAMLLYRLPSIQRGFFSL